MDSIMVFASFSQKHTRPPALVSHCRQAVYTSGSSDMRMQHQPFRQHRSHPTVFVCFAEEPYYSPILRRMQEHFALSSGFAGFSTHIFILT
jgi:hypothetical protein